MRVNPLLVPILFLSVLLGTVFGSQRLGLWSVSGRTSVNLATLTADDLKGWMTLRQVMDGTGIPKAELYSLVNIPADMPDTTALKDMEKLVPNFETSTLRDAMKARGAAPVAPQVVPPAAAPTATAPPNAATERLTGTGVLSGTHLSADGVRPTPTSMPAGVVLTVDQIKGSMTLSKVSEQTGLPLSAILDTLKLSGNDANAAIKDLISAGKLIEVTQVRDAVTTLRKKGHGTTHSGRGR